MNLHLQASRGNDLLDSFSGLRIGVIGDVMLDRYIRGRATRLSPEAPVPVVDIHEESDHPGGAANVATNLSTLGLDVALYGIVGDDLAGDRLARLLELEGIDPEFIVQQPEYQTTVKTRVIADGQHLVRADRESGVGPDPRSAERLLDLLEDSIGRLDALILQDYNKGTLSHDVIRRAIAIAEAAGVPTFVDPKRANFFSYQNVGLFKPNRREVEDALGVTISDPVGAIAAIADLRSRLDVTTVVVTLGEQGMVVDAPDSGAVHVETRAIQVADVSGAGDTVIALLAAATAAGADPVEAVLLANAGAGIVCERVGTVAVTVDELRDGIGRSADRGATRLSNATSEVGK